MVIGAPYEDNGAGCVYIYHGGNQRIQETQRISAHHIGSNIKGFGYSIDADHDIDENGYPGMMNSTGLP